ncbi:hypothetical protein PPL_05053 [Heterostelium album PN500]|uniref:Ankyrin repeat-containing protein n=1 Tax=Heterostelium pallidum (strain ATCC 26659 / Pp 5 / PN500) TaxID=670386 RepID=D3B9A9_HETP5|nr:hypothetical protein PPL_05053 [Heterostelium album PN500]EFA81821.1 hypothetical protein PPL_05053 [Heterostelium album PN500]|eukprot:XP_020433938.1 hypothetical protein PPL_05053 [Heterostelium album PN500]
MDKSKLLIVFNNKVLYRLIFYHVSSLPKSSSSSSLKWDQLIKRPDILASYNYLRELKLYLADNSNHNIKKPNMSTIENAIRYGSLEMLIFLLEHHQFERRITMRAVQGDLNEILSIATKYSRDDIIQYLLDRFAYDNWDYYSALMNTTHLADVDLLKFFSTKLLADNNVKQTNNIFREKRQQSPLLSDDKYIKMIKYIFSENRNKHLVGDIFMSAIVNNRVNVVEYLLTNHKSRFPNLTRFLVAASQSLDRFETFKWIFIGQSKSNYQVMRNACLTGNLNILSMIDTQPSMYPEYPMDIASGAGHLNLVEDLHNQYTQRCCSTQAIDNAAAGNHKRVVKWLYENRTEGGSPRSLSLAAKNGHFAMVKWLIENRPEIQYSRCIMDDCAYGGNVEILEYFEQISDANICRPGILESIVELGHLNVIKYLHERNEGSNNRYSFNENTMNLAAKHGHLNILMWLDENRTEGCTKGALFGAWKETREIVEWLLINRTEFTVIELTELFSLIDLLIEKNFCDTLECLLTLRPITKEQLTFCYNEALKQTPPPFESIITLEQFMKN